MANMQNVAVAFSHLQSISRPIFHIHRNVCQLLIPTGTYIFLNN